MHDVDEKQDDLIRLLAPTVHLRTSPDETLMHGIMATAGRPARVRTRQRGLVAVAVVAGLAAAAFAVFAALPSSSPVGGPPPAYALSITENAGYLVITIKDPAADPARYEAELKRRGLDIKITLAPVQPEDVGKVVFEEVGESGKLSYIEDPGHCTSNGSCTVGVKVPLDFKTYARITFGRTPLPGEQDEVGTPSGGDAETDALRGKTVAEVRKIVAAQGKTLLYRVGWKSLDAPADQVPGTWKIYDAAYGTNNSIVIWASPDGTAPSPPANCHRGAGWVLGQCGGAGEGN
ncbi:hypothetical protein [Plantactinospora soyae]|uniref:Uncharacterized protein n=1 Tax=Plantactinospora soyae TaxID=1544732 RepID=A0A927QUI6_9ACTN|nr:hypothetical protein [Plantactinospora soyae]MBE1484605.1 hypothetical protein [Plantactinospora soyae]